MRSRRSGTPRRFQGQLALITRESFRQNPVLRKYQQAAAARARQVGFEVEAVNLQEYGGDPRKLQRVLLARNMTGLLIGPLPDPAETIGLEWERFTAVAMTFSLKTPRLDRVESDYPAGMRMALEACRERGYLRPAYLSTRKVELRLHDGWRGAYLSAFPPGSAGGDFFLDDPVDGRAAFRKWFRRYRPDVLLGAGSVLAEARAILGATRLHPPPATVQMDLNDLATSQTGVYIGKERQCPPAVDLLVGKLLRNETGVPASPQTVLVPPLWHEGESLPRLG